MRRRARLRLGGGIGGRFLKVVDTAIMWVVVLISESHIKREYDILKVVEHRLR